MEYSTVHKQNDVFGFKNGFLDPKNLQNDNDMPITSQILIKTMFQNTVRYSTVEYSTVQYNYTSSLLSSEMDSLTPKTCKKTYHV